MEEVNLQVARGAHGQGSPGKAGDGTELEMATCLHHDHLETVHQDPAAEASAVDIEESSRAPECCKMTRHTAEHPHEGLCAWHEGRGPACAGGKCYAR